MTGLDFGGTASMLITWIDEFSAFASGPLLTGLNFGGIASVPVVLIDGTGLRRAAVGTTVSTLTEHW